MKRSPSSEASPPPASPHCRWPGGAAAQTTILNVSYDPTRELYNAYDAAFAAHWQEKTGETVTIEQSHGGSGAQARAVIDGLAGRRRDARARGRHQQDRRSRPDRHRLARPAPEQFARPTPRPSSSSSARATRRASLDWGDLVKEGVEVITPNPKTSGGARWNYLAAWAYANDQFGGDEAKIKEFVGALYKNVPVLDAGGARLDHDLRRARHRRRAARLGERGVPRHERARARRVRHRRAADLDQGGAAGRGRRRECRREGHARGGAGLSRISLQRRGAEHHRQELLSARQARGRRSGRAGALPRS